MSKHPGMVLDPNLPGPVTQCIAEIDYRGRVRIPSYLVAPIQWLNSQEGSSEALIILDEPGRIVILSWQNESPPILTRRKELIENAGKSSDAAEALRLLEDRYKRRVIPKDLRPTLGSEVIMHLGIPMQTETLVYVVRIFDTLEILSPRYRDDCHKQTPESLSDLP